MRYSEEEFQSGKEERDRTDPERRVSQRYFNVLRLLLTGVFLTLGKSLDLGRDEPLVYFFTVLANLLVVLVLGFPNAIVRRLGQDRVIIVQLVCDMVMFGVVMWSSGGFDSGLALVIMAYLAAGGLVVEGRMTLFAAALASTVLLADTLWRNFSRMPHGDFTQVGMACLSFFLVAVIARMLARRVHESAALALVRGEALGRQEALNKKIIEDLQDGIIVVSAAGRVLRANPRASELLGSQLMGNMMLADVDGSLMMQGNADDFGEVVQRFGPGGRMLRYRRVQAGPQQPDGAEGDSLIYLRDFEEVQQEVQQVKLAALGRLTASMAHEIRNPLNAIRQSTDLLAEDLEASQLHQRLLRIVRDNTLRIDRLIREVLSLGRFTQRLGEPLQLKPFLDNLVTELTLEDENERKIYEVSVDEQRYMVFDRMHLHQILTNLLTNARRYCSGKPGSVRLFTEAGARFTRLHILDDGEGIFGQDREKIFEPFFTRAAKGTGLGLYIARELAEANGGSLHYAGNAPGAHFILSGLYEQQNAGEAPDKEQDE
ncbi:MAG: PAS domain-containing sensor histidine kinase [Rhodocyclaceae bacterium]|nr:PAS domain-containing sensor histidine kinase [Rhodocyclaceae bacterium]